MLRSSEKPRKVTVSTKSSVHNSCKPSIVTQGKIVGVVDSEIEYGIGMAGLFTPGDVRIAR